MPTARLDGDQSPCAKRNGENGKIEQSMSTDRFATSGDQTQNGSLPAKPKNPGIVSSSKKSGSKEEWDICVTQSAVTITGSILAALAVGVLVPAADILLLIGTGAGVLWSVKNCRALIRDGIMSPQEKKQTRDQKIKEEREIKKKERENAKAKKAQKLREKEELADREKQCCQKLKEILDEKKKECDIIKKLKECQIIDQNDVHNDVGNTPLNEPEDATEGNPENGPLCDEPLKIAQEETQSNTINQEANQIRLEQPCIEQPEGLTFKSFTSVKLFTSPSKHLKMRSSVTHCGTKMCMCYVGEDPDCVVCNKIRSEHRLDEVVKMKCQGKPENLPETLSGDTLPSISTDNRMTEGDTVHGKWATKRVKHLEDETEEGNGEINDTSEQTVWQKGSTESNNDGKEIIGVDSCYSDEVVIDNEASEGNPNNMNSGDSPNKDIQEIIHSHKQPEDEMTFIETYASESWPFSFSLPSLDKFQKKTNSSFKWPPLTSSIIVKPKKHRKSNSNCSNVQARPLVEESNSLTNPYLNSCLCGSQDNVKCSCP